MTQNNADAWTTHHLKATGQVDHGLQSEYLLTNGTGAYAMGTAAGINTRRYHGLFIPATNPPVGRVVAVNQVLERLVLSRNHSEQILDFGSCLFKNDQNERVISPGGESLLRCFEKGLTAAWCYSWGDIQVKRELFLHFKMQAITLQYTISGLESSMSVPHASAMFEMRPLVSLRDFHSLLFCDQAGQYASMIMADSVTVEHEGQAVTIHCPGGRFIRDRQWWHGLYYPADEHRGEHPFEDNLMPGYFEFPVNTDGPTVVTLTANLGKEALKDVEATTQPRALHLGPVVSHISAHGDCAATETTADPAKRRALAIAADDFVVDRFVKEHQLATIIAGYPWFSDWGRDTFIALPGLLLTTGRYEEAKRTLRAFAEAIYKGLVPNRFDDYDDSAAHYNTVDASLWFIHGALEYFDATGDDEAWDEWLREAVVSIIEAYAAGTDGPIWMDKDGLIVAGSHDTQLTWMDAANSGVVFTPRFGKAVEINALWYNALVGLSEHLQNSDAQAAERYGKMAGQVKKSFDKVFWDDGRKCLIDHVYTDDQGETHIDPSLRPNQIFAVSLPHSPLSATKQKQVVAAVKAKLLTPLGLRTLPPNDANYHAHYRGNMFERDKAYHQGTVWGWLIGPYAEAVLRTGEFSQKAKAETFSAIEPLIKHMMADNEFQSPGQIHEIFEAQAPHHPEGCIGQAWSVAEVLRVLRLIETE